MWVNGWPSLYHPTVSNAYASRPPIVIGHRFGFSLQNVLGVVFFHSASRVPSIKASHDIFLTFNICIYSEMNTTKLSAVSVKSFYSMSYHGRWGPPWEKSHLRMLNNCDGRSNHPYYTSWCCITTAIHSWHHQLVTLFLCQSNIFIPTWGPRGKMNALCLVLIMYFCLSCRALVRHAIRI